MGFLMESVRRTVRDPTRFKYLLGVNHGVDRDLIVRNADAQGARYELIDAHVDTGYSSMNHGTCLDIVFDHMTSTYGMLVDCDVAFLHRDWDELMLAALTKGCVIVGAEYDGAKYRGFPNVICAMFDVGVIRSLGISFKPESAHRQAVLIQGESAITYGYEADSPGMHIILDTGSELPRKIKGAGLRGKHMPLFRAGHPDAGFMVGEMRGEEYQLDGVPLFTHIGRSYTRKFGVDPDAKEWERRVRERLDA